MKSCLQFSLALALLLPLLFVIPVSPTLAQPGPPQVILQNRAGTSLEKLTDGDTIRLQVVLPQPDPAGLTVTFTLAPDGDALGSCSIPAGQDRCQTDPFLALGWFWGAGGQAFPQRTIQTAFDTGLQAVARTVQVSPRPVVMVHGFSSHAGAWSAYLGPQGYLASIGVPAFAVGDGQFSGTLNTGRLDNPNGRTNTIAENARILRDYIAAVKAATGAEQVDLLAHSMGGLISRYYIGQVMEGRDVGQLLMLGSPMAGTECANLPASLGLYLPAVLEIRPSYVRQIFNPQVSDRKGVPFFALAGVPIQEAFQSPCTATPTDLAVSLESVQGIDLELSEMPILHTDLNLSPEVFDRFVRPHLKATRDSFSQVGPSAAHSPQVSSLQFTRIFNGRVEPGASAQVTIQIDPGVSVASFALYDPTRSLDVVVRGASGNQIPLSAEKNGLVVVEDPSALFYLGYGFQNPKPGAWQVTLLPTEKTPPAGASYALTAYFVGGARLEASTSTLLPRQREPVDLNVSLLSSTGPLAIQTALAQVRSPSGALETISLAPDASGAKYTAAWRPSEPGLYGIDLFVLGQTPEGVPVERTAFLAVEAQVAPASPLRVAAILGAAASPFLLALGLALVFLVRRRQQRRQTG